MLGFSKWVVLFSYLSLPLLFLRSPLSQCLSLSPCSYLMFLLLWVKKHPACPTCDGCCKYHLLKVCIVLFMLSSCSFFAADNVFFEGVLSGQKSLSSWRNWKRACALCFLHANVCKLLPITVFPVASIPSWFSLVCGWSRIEEDLVAPSFHLFAGSLFWNQIWPYFFFIYYWILYIVYQLIYFSKNTWNMYSNFPHYVFQY